MGSGLVDAEMLILALLPGTAPETELVKARERMRLPIVNVELAQCEKRGKERVTVVWEDKMLASASLGGGSATIA